MDHIAFIKEHRKRLGEVLDITERHLNSLATRARQPRRVTLLAMKYVEKNPSFLGDGVSTVKEEAQAEKFLEEVGIISAANLIGMSGRQLYRRPLKRQAIFALLECRDICQKNGVEC